MPKIKLKYPINLHKGMTGFVVLGLMLYYQNFSTAAWVYLALHGSYGFLWLVKDVTFPDRQWERPVSIGYALFAFGALALYWIAPVVLIAGHRQPAAPLLGLAVALNMWGVMLHFGSDAQKYFTLRYRSGLITEGFFRRNRNTNYLGELLIYLGFALLSAHPLGYVGITAFFLMEFIPNMRKKDRSLARYEGFAAYRQRTGLFWPKWK